MGVKRQQYTAGFKAKVALEAIREEGTLAQLSSKHKVNPNLIAKWKKRVLEGLNGLFSESVQQTPATDESRIQMLHAKIGQLTVERDFLEFASNKFSSSSARKW